MIRDVIDITSLTRFFVPLIPNTLVLLAVNTEHETQSIPAQNAAEDLVEGGGGPGSRVPPEPGSPSGSHCEEPFGKSVG